MKKTGKQPTETELFESWFEAQFKSKQVRQQDLAELHQRLFEAEQLANRLRFEVDQIERQNIRRAAALMAWRTRIGAEKVPWK